MMQGKKKKPNKIKQKLQDMNEAAGIRYWAGRQVGARGFIKHYNTYRKIVGPAAGIMTLCFFFLGQWLHFWVMFFVTNLIVLFNQLWWKLVNIQHYLETKLEGDHKDEIQRLEQTDKRASE